jgi:putative toxin-antitoxin system antitoxin component (TIGR02293 family)
MLADYDAEAVAGVMGIAFQDEPVQAGRRGGDARFVIIINRELVRVVDVGHGGSIERSARRWPPSPVLIEKAVEKGLPRPVLRHVAEHIVGTDKAKIASLEWLIVPKTTLERREEQLSPLESERTERVARLFVHARNALGTEAEARAFMTTSHPHLDGRTPVDAARTDLGTRRTEQILNALEYGLAL